MILAVTAVKEKLPAMVIFQGKYITAGYPQDIVYTIQEKAWNDTEMMTEWIKKVWHPFCVKRNKLTYMIWDKFSVHMKKHIVHQMQNFGTKVDLIHGGYTGKIQILDK